MAKRKRFGSKSQASASNRRDDDPLLPDRDWVRRFRQRIVRWYADHRRDLPWRNSRDPYRVWVSEIMLQQTQVETVKAYFERFMAAFPDVAALAAADEQSVFRQWEGLGYYRRARQLHAAAQVVTNEHDGVLPTDIKILQSLPGIGRYTAGAILSIAMDQAQPILEANTLRLFARLLAYPGMPTKGPGQKLLWAFAERLVPKAQPGRFNQAVMELGSLVCTPKNPDCQKCPARKLCVAYEREQVELIPAIGKRTEFTSLLEAAIVVQDGNRFLLRRCQAGERWAGLWDFPRAQRDPDIAAVADDREFLHRIEELTGNRLKMHRHLATIKHGVTRYRITLECHLALPLGKQSNAANNERKWLRCDELDQLPLSTTGRKIAKMLAGGETKRSC